MKSYDPLAMAQQIAEAMAKPNQEHIRGSQKHCAAVRIKPPKPQQNFNVPITSARKGATQ